MKCATVVAICLLAATICTVAQERALISGDAEDKQDSPIAGVEITLNNDSLGPKATRTTHTNSDGLYFFPEVVPFQGYTIEVKKPGLSFSPPSVKFDVEVGETRHVLPSFISSESQAAPTPQSQRQGQSDAANPALLSLGFSPSFRSADQLMPVRFVTLTGNAALVLASDLSPDVQGSTAQQQTGSSKSGPQQKPSGTTSNSGSKNSKKRGKADSVTLSTSLSTVITSEQLRKLPLYNRNFLAVGLLVSSTHDVPAWSELKDTTFSISGQRPTQNSFLLDGMENEASSSNQAIPFQVNDAIQEFRVVTANSDAQFGRNIGGVVNVITQRGTARFHGSVFGFFADSSIDASSPLSVYGGTTFNAAAGFAGPVNAPPAQNANGNNLSPLFQPVSYNQYVNTIDYLNTNYGTSFCAAPNATSGSPDCLQTFDAAAFLAQHDSRTQPFSSQQFGAQAGGSFAQRWFWFGDYEGTRINNPNPIFERVPSSYDRSHLSEFTGQQGYASAAIAQQVLSLYPQSNLQAIPDVLEFYQGQAPNYTNVDNYLGRLDFIQSDHTDWTFRYNLQDLSQLHDDSLPSSSFYSGNGAQRAVLNQNLVGTFTHRYSERLTNVIRLGFTQFRVKETPQDANFNAIRIGLPAGPMPTFLLSGLDPQYAGADAPTATSAAVNGAWGGWSDSAWHPPYPNVTGSWPIITPTLDGLFPFARIGAPFNAPGMRQDREIELADNVVWVKGKHTLRAGGDARWLSNVFNNAGFSRGMVVSGDIGEFTSDSETCISITCHPAKAFKFPSFDYALKQPDPFDTHFHSYAIAGYGQDTWRLGPNLTINAGLRYEYFSPPTEANQQIWNYDPVANGLVEQGGTDVLDPYGTVCAGKNTLWRSVYAGGTKSLKWNCNTSGNGNFLVSSTTNFEPRVGVAWSTPSGDTVIRAAFGIFYDEVPVSQIAELAFNRPVSFSATSPQAIYGQNFAVTGSACGTSFQCGLGNASLVKLRSPINQAASIPFSLSAIDPNNFSNPFTRQVSLSITHQFTRSTTAELQYIGNYEANLPTTSNTGFNNEWFCTVTPTCDAFSFLPIFTLANRGYGNYNAFVAKLTTRNWHGFQARASYTYSKALDNASQAGAPLIPGPLITQVTALGHYGTGNPQQFALGFNNVTFQPPANTFSPGAVAANFSALTTLLTAGVSTTGAGRVLVTPYTVPQDPYNFLRNDYGPSDYNQTNRFILEFTWDAPASIRSAWLKNWMLSGVLTAESGQPFTIFAGPVAGELTERVSLTAPLVSTGNPLQYFANPSAIQMPGQLCENLAVANSPYAVQTIDGIRAGTVGQPCLGNTARNQFTGPGYVDYDMAVQRLFKISERLALSLRAESYNLFNHPNYYNPISAYSLDGVTQYSQFGQIKSAHKSRQFQFGVRLNW